MLPIEATVGQLAAAPGFMLVASYNTGYRNLLKGLKPSTRQCFVVLSLIPMKMRNARSWRMNRGTSGQVAVLVRVGRALHAIAEHEIEEIASTRLLIHTARLIRTGISPLAACEACIAHALTDEPATLEGLLEVMRAHFPQAY